jgi:putative heme-binding domain-containing protein
MYRTLLPWLLFCSFLRADGPAAVERWTDPRLKVTTGLTLWLDAGRQPAAWQAHGKPVLPDGAALDVWYDGSGNHLDLVQRFQASQPRFVQAGDSAVVRFDGKSQCLGLAGQNRSLHNFTVVLVVAPRSSPGGYRAFLAANETGKNDYTTGFTLDMTADPSILFNRFNVEGKGFGGAVNLMKGHFGYPFGEFHVVTVVCREHGIDLQIDDNGNQQAGRNRADGLLRMDELTLGARCYSNTAAPPYLSGFLDGDIAETLLYDRSLQQEELVGVQDYLLKKHANLAKALAAAAPRQAHLLQSVPTPPPVQMLVPGFTVHELPVDLTNINNVRYRSDGKLVALAYNGNIYLLSDPSGNGLESKVELFWENKGELRAPIGMALTPPGYPLGTGVFVACKGKLSLIVDTHNRGKADKEIVVATGWQELSHGVDALGVALDKDGNLYFGLGCADFTNAYLLDKEGKAHYDLGSERGTILKVSPDFRKREIICTGIRFPVGLAFNHEGDLFATDQEGATWLPNGNPLDKLLHIQPGRHYGFPPRHPRHLPGVIDEPSVFEYGPQHQSTCGLQFNESVNGGPVFGPAWWQGDALITGYSRGKLYRTKLVKTPTGYVAQNQLLATLNMLAVDACVSPKGDLVVAVHSGQPDWGSGPEGKGKLYKIFYTDKDTPQPVLAWAANPREVRIAFDRPLDPEQLKNLAQKVKIEYGAYVRPGDRFEALRPGYATVGMQLAAPRKYLAVLGVQVTADRRTLLLATEPHPEATHYAVTLPGLGRRENSRRAQHELPQVPQIDLAYDLCGIEASWKDAAGNVKWTGWLPHPDLTVARTFTQSSAEHDTLWQLLPQNGKLIAKFNLNPAQLTRPAVQPGSTLDYSLPPEEVAIKMQSASFQMDTGWQRYLDGRPIPLAVDLPTGDPMDTARVSYCSKEDDRPHSLPLDRFLLPWAPTKEHPPEIVIQQPPELKGGNWARGRQVFFSDQALCSRCHMVAGQGGRIGPDLSNLVHRDFTSVLRDIHEPSAAINPDFITYSVELKDGRVFAGVVRTERDNLIIGDNTGKEVTVAKSLVETLTPAKISTMPEGLDKTLGPDKMRDLLTFLLTEPLKPAPAECAGLPPPRSRAEVEAVLKALPPSTEARRPLHIVLAAGPKDHGPGEHDYPLWQRRWVKLLELDETVRVSEAPGWPTARQLATADLIVFYSNNPAWSEAKTKELDAFLERGGGLVYLHFAVAGHGAVDALADRIGLAWKDGVSRFRHGPLELSFPDDKHPITRGFEKVKFVDESYWQLTGDPKKIHILATAIEEGAARPLFWTREHGKGRVFVSIPGHYTWTFDDPLFRILILRGMAWATGGPVDRFNSLVYQGAWLRE